VERNSGSFYILYKMNVAVCALQTHFAVKAAQYSQSLFLFVVQGCSDRWKRNFIFYKTPQEKSGWGFRFGDKGSQKLK